MIRFKNVVCTAALLLACTQVFAINKCTAADGKVVFQDAPCAGKSEVVGNRSAVGQSPGAVAPAVDWKAKAMEADKRLAISAAVDRREAMIGMNNEQLQLAMGLPSRINTGEYSTGNTQQRIYERGALTWYVYTDGKIVTAVQTSASLGAPAQPAACPSSLEIKNEETSASSNTLSEAERVVRQKRISAMRNCGK